MNKCIASAKEMTNVLNRLAYEVIEKETDLNNVAFIGIRSRGDVIAERIRARVKKSTKAKHDLGILDITLYRDDLSLRGDIPEVKSTTIDFDINNRHLIIVDDILFTGRTVRAALNALFDYGRPASVKLLVMVDRGNRQLPIAADYVGITLATGAHDRVRVRVKETDGEDGILLEEKR